MVKGVNKTVIEINETGSKIFEKIVLYVSPKYSNLDTKQISKAAENLSINYDELNKLKCPLRKKWYKKKLMLFSVFLFVAAFWVGIYFIFK